VSEVLKKYNARHAAHVVSNPEFLREGSAIQDFMHPDRIVVGSNERAAAEKVAALYAPLHAPVLVTPNIYTAEMVKYASNAFLAARISFINEIAWISERVGADAKLVAEGMGLDKRIGPAYLDAGIGYGGSCLVGDETVLVREAGRTKLVSMERLVREHQVGQSLEVLAWDRSGVEFLPVRLVTLRGYEGDVLEVRTKMGRRVVCTPDHPFVTREGVKLARDLTRNDWLPLALAADHGPNAVSGYGVREGLEAVVAMSVRQLRPALSNRTETALKALNNATEFPLTLAADPAVWRVIGFHLAEGRNCNETRIPDLIWEQPIEHKLALLSGYWHGEGSWNRFIGGASVVLECGTVSRNLADGILRLLADLGIVASLRVDHAKDSTRDTYWISCSSAEQRVHSTGCKRDGEHTAWVRVVDVKSRRYSGAVYSMEVPGSHTFVTTGGLVTHNCFPKDVAALAAVAQRFDYHPELLHAVMDINRDQRMKVIDLLREELEELPSRIIGLLGLAFKPNTDDMREAPSVDIARVLLAAGAEVRAYDPAAIDRSRALLPDVEYVNDAYEVAVGADALVLITEWNEFRQLDMARVKQLMRQPVIVDGRNIYDPAVMKSLGFTYRGIGRE
jgi:UDP-glucose 6-dehydrogenase